MHVIGLEVENFQRIKALSIKPDATGAVVISGKNDQGKSSILDAIWAALGGRRGNTSPKPVREGASQAKVVVDLGDMTVTRVWRNDTSAVTVRAKDGAEYKSPQVLLDSFIGRLSFDPLEFTRLKAREQKEALLQLVELDVDLDKLQAKRDELYDARTEIGRERSRIGDPVVDETIPVEEVQASEIIAAIQAARDAAFTARKIEEAIGARERDIEANVARIAELQAANKALADQVSELRAQAAAAPAPVDVDALEAKLGDVEAENARIRANNQNRAAVAQATELDQQKADLTAQIEAVDAQKAEALGRAKFPVDGLGFDADGVTFNGNPFSIASSAQKIRVSVGMAIAANPKLRVGRIMDGSLLDEESMRIVAEMAREHDFQLWVEMVRNGDGVGFVIEDGELVSE